MSRPVAAERPPPVVTALLDRRVGAVGRLVTFLVCVGVVVVVALVDHAAGHQYSFFVLYLVPVVAGALLLRAPEAYALVLVATVAWGAADFAVFDEPRLSASLWNVFGRFVTFSAMAYLLFSLRTAVERATASDRRSREFLATAAHQLRTPLAGLIASAEAMSVERDPAVRDRLLANLVAGTNRARRLLAQLLEMSRLDRASTVDRRVVDIDDVCVREVELVALANPNLTVAYDGPGHAVMSPSGDAVREAVANLLDNAARHARSSVHVVIRERKPHVTVEVRDDGDGLEDGAEERAFERFVSLDAKGGSGLGLPIARAAMETVGGGVTYRNGAFVITAPVVG